MANDNINTRAEIINQLDQKGDPYFNRFDASQDRTALLFVYDNYLQNAELNELQSIQNYYLGALGNIIAKDGDMQQGMGFIQDGNNITVKDGLVYLAGKVRNFKQQTVSITGKGLEAVSVRLRQSVITYEDDNSLLGIAPDQNSTNAPGARRLVETVELVANDNAAAPIYQFNDGKLYLESQNSQLSKINDVVAKHDFNALGSYAIGSNESSGFQMSVGKSISDKAGWATLNIAAGKAYVQGYEVDKPYASQIDIRQALDTEQIKNEQHVYVKGNDVYSLNLANVKSVDLVSAQVQDDISVTHGMSGGSDYIVDNLVSVDLVYTSGTNGKQWQQGTDFNVQGNSIIWNGASGSQPAPNSSYMVRVTYNKVLHDNGIDFISTIDDKNSSVATIDFSKGKGDGSHKASKPKINGYITVTYTAYLYRIDIVTLDRYGNFTIIEGVPDRASGAQPPIVNDPLTLTIGTVTMYPNSDFGFCNTVVNTNLTFKDLNLLKRRIINLEYNNAINSLNDQERQRHDPTVLRGIYTDNFVDDIKFNSTYETSSNVTEPFKANINMNVLDKYITLPYTDQSPVDLLFNSSQSMAQMLNANGHLLTAAFTEEPMIEQDIVTSAININRLNIGSFEGILNITPNSDHWTTQNVINHYNSTINRNYVRDTIFDNNYKDNGAKAPTDRNQYHSYQAGGYYSVYNPDGTPVESSWVNPYWETSTYYDPVHYERSEDTQIIKTNVLDPVESVYMRSIDVKFSVVGLAPYADNLELYFGGVKCPIKPDTGYSTGSSASGSIMALSDGSAKGTFTIPANTIRCGTVDVELKALNNTAHTSYTASGTQQNITKEITPVHTSYWHYDPVAESFFATMDAQITSVDLKFASKSNTAGVTVQLREMSSSGYPTSTIKASTYLAPTDIKVSNDGSVWTTAHFSDPIPVSKGESLAISVACSSNDCTIWQGKLGEAIVGTKKGLQGGELYSEGVMFESSNNATWSADQSSDLAFRVNIAHYSTEPCVAVFDPIKNVKADEFALLATYLTPANTKCTWEYRAVYQDDTSVKLEDKPWLPVTAGSLNQLSDIIVELQLRATFKATDYVSPLLSLSSLVFGKYLSALRGDYVTLNVNSSDSPFNRIYLSYVESLPDKSSVVPQYSLDEGKTWRNFTSEPTLTIIDGYGSKKVSYVEKLTDTVGKEIMFHLKLSTTRETARPLVAQFIASWTQE